MDERDEKILNKNVENFIREVRGYSNARRLQFYRWTVIPAALAIIALIVVIFPGLNTTASFSRKDFIIDSLVNQINKLNSNEKLIKDSLGVIKTIYADQLDSIGMLKNLKNELDVRADNLLQRTIFLDKRIKMLHFDKDSIFNLLLLCRRKETLSNDPPPPPENQEVTNNSNNVRLVDIIYEECCDEYKSEFLRAELFKEELNNCCWVKDGSSLDSVKYVMYRFIHSPSLITDYGRLSWFKKLERTYRSLDRWEKRNSNLPGFFLRKKS